MSRTALVILTIAALPTSCASAFEAQQLASRCDDEGTRLAGCTSPFENLLWFSSLAFIVLFCWALNKLIIQRKND